MTTQAYKKCLRTIVQWSQDEKFHSLQQAADHFNCSKSTVKRMLGHLRALGYNIQYCRYHKKFYIGYRPWHNGFLEARRKNR